MTTSADIVNEAIQQIGDNQSPVTGVVPTFDSSPAGVAAAKLYIPCVQTVGRQFGWDFARFRGALTLTGNVAVFPWNFEYFYPPDAIQIWQVAPPLVADTNNPLPLNWEIANRIVAGNQVKIINCDIAQAIAVYNNSPNENTWDPLFKEAVVRLLASGLAMALTGRPDTAQFMIESGAAFERLGERRDS